MWRRVGVQVIELELATGNPMLYVYEDGAFKRRGSPVGPAVDGVYALTPVSTRWPQYLGNPDLPWRSPSRRHGISRVCSLLAFVSLVPAASFLIFVC
jgi:hypothetical protein